MRLSRQIALATLGTTAVVVALVAWLLYLSVARGFAGYLGALDKDRLHAPVQRLADHYRQHRSWQAFVDDPRSFRRLVRRPDDKPPSREPASVVAGQAAPLAEAGSPAVIAIAPSQVRPTDPLDLPPRVTLYDASGKRVTGRGSVTDEAVRVEIVVDGHIVGWLGLRALEGFHDRLDVLYIEHVRNSVLVIGAVALLVSAVASVLLARRVVEPVLRLRDATRRLTQGEYAAVVGLARDDELGELARDVDTLAATLAANARARRQWVADTSHELRTPLTVLRGEVEAMLDGVRPLDPAALRSLEGELVRLGKLVDDLAQLATADEATTGLAKVPIRLAAVLERSAQSFAPAMERVGLALVLGLHGAVGVRVLGDPDRLAQVFANVIENNLRYTRRGGTVWVSATVRGPTVVVRIEDDGPGVDAAHLPHLFDRLYRVDLSRSRQTGGAGLGLAICRQWIEAHGGTVAALPNDLAGLCIEISLPLYEAA
jgi:two-component system sensor histidine kinase BaeS